MGLDRRLACPPLVRASWSSVDSFESHCCRGDLLVKSALSIALLALNPVASPLLAAEKAATLPQLVTQVAFPNLRFDRPVAMAYPDDGSNRLFVIEQHQARIWSFPNQRPTSDKQLFLQLPDPIHRGNEEGLLGLAFHPKFRENQQFYVSYSADDQG